jgi:hypothetical protein
MQRGRKSRKTLEITPMLPGRGRPEPPPGLSPDEARAWRDVVDSAPSFWLDSAAQLLLRRLVLQCAIAQRKEARMRRLLLQESSSADEDLEELARSHAETAKGIAYLLTQLRLTPKARILPKGNLLQGTEAPTPQRPWEIRAKTDGEPLN